MHVTRNTLCRLPWWMHNYTYKRNGKWCWKILLAFFPHLIILHGITTGTYRDIQAVHELMVTLYFSGGNDGPSWWIFFFFFTKDKIIKLIIMMIRYLVDWIFCYDVKILHCVLIFEIVVLFQIYCIKQCKVRCYMSHYVNYCI